MAPTPASSAGPSSGKEWEKRDQNKHFQCVSGEFTLLPADPACRRCCTGRAVSERHPTHATDGPGWMWSACVVPEQRFHQLTPPGWQVGTSSVRQRRREQAVTERGNPWIYISSFTPT